MKDRLLDAAVFVVDIWNAIKARRFLAPLLTAAVAAWVLMAVAAWALSPVAAASVVSILVSLALGWVLEDRYRAHASITMARMVVERLHRETKNAAKVIDDPIAAEKQTYRERMFSFKYVLTSQCDLAFQALASIPTKYHSSWTVRVMAAAREARDASGGVKLELDGKALKSSSRAARELAQIYGRLQALILAVD